MFLVSDLFLVYGLIFLYLAEQIRDNKREKKGLIIM